MNDFFKLLVNISLCAWVHTHIVDRVVKLCSVSSHLHYFGKNGCTVTVWVDDSC